MTNYVSFYLNFAPVGAFQILPLRGAFKGAAKNILHATTVFNILTIQEEYRTIAATYRI